MPIYIHIHMKFHNFQKQPNENKNSSNEWKYEYNHKQRKYQSFIKLHSKQAQLIKKKYQRKFLRWNGSITQCRFLAKKRK